MSALSCPLGLASRLRAAVGPALWLSCSLLAACDGGATGGPEAARPADRAVAPWEVEPARQFDFWIGAWNVNVRNLRPDGSWVDTAEATAHVHSILDGKAILELWDGRTPFGGTDPATRELTTKGFSLRYWDPQREQWVLALNWPSPGNPGYSKLEGSFRHGRGDFYQVRFRRDTGERVLVRYTFSDATPDSLRWNDGVSYDDGQTWGEATIFEFTRTAPTAPWPDPGGTLLTDDDGRLCAGESFRRFDFLIGGWTGILKSSGEGRTTSEWSVDLEAFRVLDGCGVLGLLETTRDGDTLHRFQLYSYLPRREEWVALQLDSTDDGDFEILGGTFDDRGIVLTQFHPEPTSDVGPWNRSLVEPAPAEGPTALTRWRWELLGDDRLRFVMSASGDGGERWTPEVEAELHRRRAASTVPGGATSRVPSPPDQRRRSRPGRGVQR